MRSATAADLGRKRPLSTLQRQMPFANKSGRQRRGRCCPFWAGQLHSVPFRPAIRAGSLCNVSAASNNAQAGAAGIAPIFFCGTARHAVKGYVGTTHRACTPEVTLDRVRPLLPRAGITRMADITGLDRIGVPTVLAMRPNAPTLANTSGKGFTRTAAMVSAAMEGIEMQFAEDFACSDNADGHASGLHTTYRELDRSGLVCPIELLPVTRHSTFTADTPEDWVIGFDLIAQRPMAVPFACVSMRSGYFRERSRFSFQAGSNGLASGNVFLEAVCSGLAEVIERDAVTCAKLRSGGQLERERPADVASAGFDSVSELLERFRRSGITPLVFDCTTDTAVPTYVAYLFDDLEPNTGVFRGYGANLYPEVAIIRALTEAAQGRAVYIAGSRDDLLGLEHRRMRRTGVSLTAGVLAHAGTEPARVPSPPTTTTFEEDCAILLERLGRAGLHHVIVVDLAPPDLPVSVVRVVVPGLEGYSSFAHYTPGPRGRAARRQGIEDGPAGGARTSLAGGRAEK